MIVHLSQRKPAGPWCSALAAAYREQGVRQEKRRMSGRKRGDQRSQDGKSCARRGPGRRRDGQRMGTGGEGRGRNEAGTLGAAPSQTRSILGRWLPSAADVIMRPPPSHCVPPAHCHSRSGPTARRRHLLPIQTDAASLLPPVQPIAFHRKPAGLTVCPTYPPPTAVHWISTCRIINWWPAASQT